MEQGKNTDLVCALLILVFFWLLCVFSINSYWKDINLCVCVADIVLGLF